MYNDRYYDAPPMRGGMYGERRPRDDYQSGPYEGGPPGRGRDMPMRGRGRGGYEMREDYQGMSYEGGPPRGGRDMPMRGRGRGNYEMRGGFESRGGYESRGRNYGPREGEGYGGRYSGD